LNTLAEELPGLSGCCRADVSRPDEVQSAFGQADEVLGGLDVLIANAGISNRSNFLETSFEQWRSVLGVNLDGAFLCSR